MRIAAATVHPYALPLVRPWVASRATLTERRGRLLAVTSEDGLVGWGDCAPLPSSGEAGHARVFQALNAAVRGLPGRDTADVSPSDVPEVRWAIETALFDLEARRAGLPLRRFLRSSFPVIASPRQGTGARNDEPRTIAPVRVPINAALGPLDAGCADRAEAAAERGFAVGKIKVGVGAIDDERRALADVIERARGRLRVRLDANRAWPEAEARRFLESLVGLPIDGVEEPLADPTPAALAHLQKDLPFPLAADESLPVLGVDALLEARAVRRLVVKPARLGGIRATLALAAQAQTAGVELVLTSVVDSTVGVTAAAHLAAALPTENTHGLGTLDWLTRDVAPPPVIVDGALCLPAGPGLGLVPKG
ncbi:mandelate racemase/muconate lactonizing enzyme family protein [Rhodospira trueperi]|uniref:o-succinylbenzoate synthase n=1 Tax=Rhodospira trueperi TaxID=69960 RepID=A0A1G7B343_9PROT|nr:enolase C-terminal domain-like protein [Rhodospira trueperi]SDE21340.1 O-succinylbenzoate synthase [Rhodospira trueperi]